MPSWTYFKMCLQVDSQSSQADGKDWPAQNQSLVQLVVLLLFSISSITFCLDVIYEITFEQKELFLREDNEAWPNSTKENILCRYKN